MQGVRETPGGAAPRPSREGVLLLKRMRRGEGGREGEHAGKRRDRARGTIDADADKGFASTACAHALRGAVGRRMSRARAIPYAA